MRVNMVLVKLFLRTVNSEYVIWKYEIASSSGTTTKTQSGVVKIFYFRFAVLSYPIFLETKK